MNVRPRLLTGLLALSLLCLPALAQESRGSIQGRVTDPSDAPVAGAGVLVENRDTGTTVRLTANPTGHYEANLLLPGNYRVTAESSGFKKSIRNGAILQYKQECNEPCEYSSERRCHAGNQRLRSGQLH